MNYIIIGAAAVILYLLFAGKAKAEPAVKPEPESAPSGSEADWYNATVKLAQACGAPNLRAAQLIAAHTAIETAFGSQLHDNNYGNITKGTWKKRTVSRQDQDGHGNTITQVFRAYDSPEEGMKDYINAVSSWKWYHKAWQALLDENDRFLWWLGYGDGVTGWYTADKDTMQARAEQILAQFAPRTVT